MEGNYLFRVTGIIALFLGAVWVLLPTWLRADSEELLANSAASVDTPANGTGSALEVLFETDDVSTAVGAVKKRLATAGTGVDGVRARDGRVQVLLQPGTSSEDVQAALDLPSPTWHRLADQTLDGLPSADAELAAALVGQPALGDALVVDLQPADGGWVLDGFTAPEDPATEARLVAARKGKVLAVGAVDETGQLQLVGYTGDIAELDIEPLGVSLTRYEAPVVVDEAPREVVVNDRVPVWLDGLLPDTQLNRGLDLMGGIDLTLQVELEEAVLAKVARDLAYFRQMAEEEGVSGMQAKPDPISPRILVTSDEPLSVVQGFISNRMPDYIYSETDGNTHMFGMREEVQDEVSKQAVEQVLETLRNRVDATGVKEPSIVKKGGGRINVQLPGEVDVQSAVEALGTTAVLDFRLVDEEFDPIKLGEIVADAERDLPADQYADDDVLNRYFWRTGKLAEDRWVLWEYADTVGEEGRTDQKRETAYVVKEIALTGAEVNDASVAWDPNTQFPYVALEFKPRGANLFCTLTRENVGKRFAIVLDDQVRSAPTIRDQICGGRASIDMGSSLDALQDANTLALVLRTGSLTAPVSVGQVRQVGPTLGKDAIRAGTIGTFIGGTMVLLFMFVWYRLPGLLANVALMMNVLLVLSLIHI